MTGPRVFVSHSHQDDPFTKRLVADLAGAGADVWVDVDGIVEGDYQEHINHALAGCQWYVLVLSPEAIGSNWVRMETNAAIQRKMAGQLKEILPVVAHPIDTATIPPTWDTFQRFDATSDYPGALARLLRAMGLTSTRQAPPVSGTTPMPEAPIEPSVSPTPAVSPAPAAATAPPVPVARAPRHTPSPRSRIALAAILVLLLVGSGTAAVFSARGVLFSQSSRSPQTPQTHSNGQPSPTTDPAATAAQWQPVIAAVQAYCAAIEEQDYHKSFGLLSQRQQNTTGEEKYTVDTSKWDDYTGKLILCEPHLTSGSDFIRGGQAVITFSVQRTSEKTPDTGMILVVKEGDIWRVDTLEYSLMLF